MVAEGAAKADDIAKEITEKTGLESRAVVLGHIQRGGRPTAFSRDLALRLGQIAVESLLNGEVDKAVGFSCGQITTVDFDTAIRKKDLKFQKLYNLIKILT